MILAGFCNRGRGRRRRRSHKEKEEAEEAQEEERERCQAVERPQAQSHFQVSESRKEGGKGVTVLSIQCACMIKN